MANPEPKAGSEIWICSRTAPTYAGGLAAYQLGLARELSVSHRARIRFVALEAFHKGETPVRELPENTHILGNEMREHPGFWSRMASRPPLHGILEQWIAASCSINRIPNAPYPDVVLFVGTGWDYMGFAMLHFARKAGALFAVWPAVHPGNWGDDRIDLRLYKKADMVFCQSNYEIQHLVSKGLPLEKTCLCSLPPMCNRNGDGKELRERYQIGQRPAVLFLGRRDEGKGYPALLKAWPEVLQKVPEAILLLAGPGGNEFQSLSDSLPSISKIDFGIPDEKLKADLLSACDIFCVPSAQESFGIVFAEAWSYGKPVVCGPAPATREWMGNGERGLWAEQLPEEIARQLLRLLADPELSDRIGKAGSEYQRQFLTWKNTAAIHQTVFLKAGRSSPAS